MTTRPPAPLHATAREREALRAEIARLRAELATRPPAPAPIHTLTRG